MKTPQKAIPGVEVMLLQMNVEACLLYIIISALCIGGLLHFFLNIRKYAEDNMTLRFFLGSLLLTIVLVVTDLLSAQHYYGVIRFGDSINQVIETIDLLAGEWSVFFWFVFSETSQKSFFSKHKGVRLLCFAPLAFITAVVLTNSRHHWVFLCSNGAYQTGPLWEACIVVPIAFVMYSGISSLVRSFQGVYYANRRKFRMHFYYAAILAVAVCMQLFIPYELPCRTVCATIVYYIAQMRIMQANIYIDQMADINNRTAMDRFLTANFDRATEDFWFIFMDLNGFKGINDTWGHSAGDRVIGYMAKALKKAAFNGVVVARFGGDEFAAAGVFGSEERVKAFLRDVQNELDLLSAEDNVSVKFSAGYAGKTPDITTVPQLIGAADKMMYRNKAKSGKKESERNR